MFGELLDCTVDWTAVVQVSCLAAPPAAPAGATSNWDGSSNTAGTVITFTCTSGQVQSQVINTALPQLHHDIMLKVYESVLEMKSQVVFDNLGWGALSKHSPNRFMEQ